MGSRKMFSIALVAVFFILFSLQSAVAKSKYQEYQDSLFAKIPVKPGDVIDTSNWQKVKDLLPPKMLEYVKIGEYVLNIGKYGFDAECDEEWEKASAKNEGKYGVEPQSGEIIEAATGKFPVYLYGYPFPNIDPKDPQAGSKILYNHLAQEYRSGSVKQHYGLALVGEKTGFERDVEGWWRRYNYWCRADGQQDNPSKLRSMRYTHTQSPYDLAGNLGLERRPLGDKPDIRFQYIPAVRRIRRLGAGDRSSPSLGTDGVTDDLTGWCGRNGSMQWKLIREQVSLQSVIWWAAEKVETMVKKPDGSWETPPRPEMIKLGYQVDGWKGAPWSVVNVVWIPVEVYVVEANAKDPYYAYGRTLYWIEKKTGTSIFKEITNRAGEQWKTSHFGFLWDKWWEPSKMSISDGTFWHFIDDKLRHATLYSGMCNREGKTFPVWYHSPELVPDYFTLRNMRKMAK